jgi:hypothetical protein
MNTIVYGLFPAALTLVAACATSAVPPRSQAAEVERIQCGSGEADSEDLAVLQTAGVIKAEPLYSHVLTGNNGAEERMDGVKLLLRPPDGVSADRMTRIIQCHSARAFLGKVDRAKLPDDPFFLPDTWVSVEVRPENGNYAVILEANDLSTNLQLAAHARAYAEAHPLTQTVQ